LNHWTPIGGELKSGDVTLHATICVACCGLDWKEFFEQKRLTPEKYRVQWSLNAQLPERLLTQASALYEAQARYFQFD
jgi:hypothetical protein